ncbi:MAG: bifunctional glutamate N-acetyltransferase/amino-acid acetyltransferase ArgJ [Arenicella sp.]
MAVGLKQPEQLLPVAGVTLSAVATGMRYKNRDDLLLIHLDEGSVTAAVFTLNRYCAAPVTVAKQHLERHQPRVLLINAGSANAGTGKQGLESARLTCQLVAEKAAIQEEQVLPFSTGVIGMQLPMSEFTAGINAAMQGRGQADWYQAAKAIMTTDTQPKAFSEQVQLGDVLVTVTGIAKGSGMICPNMATMLGYIVTDAAVSADVLKEMLQTANGRTFNRITVDSDTSTNDALTLTATGQAGNQVVDDFNSSQAQALYQAIHSVARQLAHAIVRDGEGATKFIEIEVNGGSTEQDCSAVAYTVAHSPLVKTALFASDPNWGRILAAVGRAPVSQLDIEAVNITVNGVSIIANGEPAADYSEEKGQQAFTAEEIYMRIDLGHSRHQHIVWTCDLSHEYVTINADYRS